MGDDLDVSGEGLATTLYALRDRRLIDARRRKGQWSISITEAGRYYLLHRHHPARPDKMPGERGLDAAQQATSVTLPMGGVAEPSDGQIGPATHDVEWMADQIGMSADWILRHRDEIPHHKFGSRVRFTDKDLAVYLEITAWRPRPMATTGPRRSPETTGRPRAMETTGRKRRWSY